MEEKQTQKPWENSDFACASSQSLYIINIICKTCDLFDETQVIDLDGLESLNVLDESQIESYGAVSSIKFTYDFGFTIGATKDVLECISSINKMNRLSIRDAPIETLDRTYQDLLSQLELCGAQLAASSPQKCLDSTSVDEDSTINKNACMSDAARFQLGAFISATYIYFYRTVFDLPPRKLMGYVRETFENVQLFISHDCGNFSLWPAFIAAVEAFTDEDIASAELWLATATSFGLGSRILVKQVIEEVWKRREVVSAQTGMDKGLISIDWRQVMKELDIDILLI